MDPGYWVHSDWGNLLVYIYGYDMVWCIKIEVY